MIRRILVGVDGSEPSKEAAHMAGEIAERFDASILLMYVVPPVVVPADTGGAELAIIEANRAAGEDALERIKAAVGRPGIRVDTAVGFGSVAETLTDMATAENADLVVVGSRGRGAVARVLLGSTADRLGHVCRRPLLIVHGKAPSAGGNTP